MKLLLALVAAILTVLAMALKIVMEREYSYWGTALAESLIKGNRWLLPPSRCDRVEEWLAELDYRVREEGNAGVTFALGTVMASLHLRVTNLTTRHRAEIQLPPANLNSSARSPRWSYYLGVAATVTGALGLLTCGAILISATSAGNESDVERAITGLAVYIPWTAFALPRITRARRRRRGRVQL